MIFQEDYDIIPMFGLPAGTHMIIFGVLIPIAISMIMVIIFPRVFTPIFIKLKKKIYFRYTDAFIERTPTALTKRRFLIRGIYIILLTMGLHALIGPFISYKLFLNAITIQTYVDNGLDPAFTMNVLTNIIGMLLPISISLWSIGWAMEDAGIMHYRVEDKRPGKELYEIEPIHIKYTSYLKGYAGISSIIFIVQLVLNFVNVGGAYTLDAFMIVLFLVIAILLLIPAYLVYAKVNGNNSYLRKDLKELKQITESEILKTN